VVKKLPGLNRLRNGRIVGFFGIHSGGILKSASIGLKEVEIIQTIGKSTITIPKRITKYITNFVVTRKSLYLYSSRHMPMTTPFRLVHEILP
jgi:hypothetical protein